MANIPLSTYDPAIVTTLNLRERLRTGFTHYAEVDYKYLNQVTGGTGDYVFFKLFETNNNYLLTRCALVVDEVFAGGTGIAYIFYSDESSLFSGASLHTTGPKPGAAGFIAKSTGAGTTDVCGLDGETFYLSFSVVGAAPGSYTQGKFRFFYNLVCGRY